MNGNKNWSDFLEHCLTAFFKIPEKMRMVIIATMVEAFPRACLHDGVFHILELSSGFIGQNIYNISVATRTHFYTPVVAGNARKLHITLEIPQLLMIDGDIVSVNATELTVSVIQKGVQCCI